jgi:hypothetical protein
MGRLLFRNSWPMCGTRRIDIIVVDKVLRARRDEHGVARFPFNPQVRNGLAAFCPATISSSLRSTVTSRCQCMQ